MDIAAMLRAAGARLKLSVRSHTRNTCRYLRDLWLWLCEPLLFYLAILAVGIPVGVSFWWPDENIVRYAGLVLQLLGIGTVAWGIRKTRKLFGHPSFWRQARQRFGQWLRERPKYRRGIVVGVGSASAAAAGSRARAFVWNIASPDAAVEQRLEAIEKNLTRVRDDLSKFQEKTDEEIAKQDEALKQEQQDRTRADQETRDLLTVTETGGLHISMVGVILLFFGVAMSTVSAELADYLFQPVHGFLLN